jgi:hypothetical protein
MRPPLFLLGSWFAYALAAAGCGEPPGAPGAGRLSLSLEDAAGSASAVLAHAHLRLTGPTELELDVTAASAESYTLPAGVYSLEVAEDYLVVKRDDPSEQVPAKLLGENPTTILVAPDEQTEVGLHFEVEAPETPSFGTGKVAVSVQIDDREGPASCAKHLRITELDYDQPGTDGAEFIEVASSRSCAASLANVTLELVNGGDGSVYARYPLMSAAAVLSAGTALVVGDPALLAGLPAGLPALPLSGSGLQNGPDAVRLMLAGEVLDSVAYEGVVMGAGHGEPAAVDDGPMGLTRCLATGDDARAFRLVPPTPGNTAPCTDA